MVTKWPFKVVLQNRLSEKFLQIHGKTPTVKIFLAKFQTQAFYFSKDTFIKSGFLLRNFQNNFL